MRLTIRVHISLMVAKRTALGGVESGDTRSLAGLGVASIPPRVEAVGPPDIAVEVVKLTSDKPERSRSESLSRLCA